MRVLFVTHGVKDMNTAVFRNTAVRAELLRQRGHDAHVLTPIDVGLRHHPLLPIVYPIAAAWRVLRTPPFNIVVFQSHNGCVYQLLKRVMPSHRGTRVAVAFHGLDFLYVKALEAEGKRSGAPQRLRFRLLHQLVLPRLARWSCRRARRVFFMNDRERAFLLENRWTAAEHLRWMPNCVETRSYAAPGRVAAPVRFLTVAQWLPVKGTRYLVGAFTAMVRKGLDVRLTCAGTGRDPGLVLRDFPDDVRARVSVTARFEHGEAPGVYASADVFVLPSVFEGFSLALIEAMAAGLAIVATDVGAAGEILGHGRDGLIVETGDASALEAAMTALVVDSAARKRYGERAHARAAAFSCDRVLVRFAEDLLDAAGVTAGAGA